MGWSADHNARGELLLDGNEDASTLTFNLLPGHGARFPGTLRKLVIYEASLYDNGSDAINNGRGEPVRQVSQSGDTITVVRGLDGVTPISDFGDTRQRWFVENFSDAGTIGFSSISVKSFGAVGDGVVDDSDAFDDCFNAVPTGSTVYIPEGTWLLSSWPAGGRSYSKVLRVQGNGGRSVVRNTLASPYVGTFLDIKDEFVIEGVTFQHWLEPLTLDALSTNVSNVRISNCYFNTAGSALSWLTVLAGANVVLLQFTDNICTVLSEHAVRMIGAWDSCVVSRNYISNIDNGRGISLGNSTASLEGRWVSQDIINNVILGVDKGTLGIARGIEVFGRGSNITGNEVKNIKDGTTESTGIYLESKYSSVTGNHVSNVEGSARNVGIQVQGNDNANSESGAPDGFSVTVTGNTIDLFDATGTMGILAANDDITITGNVIQGIREAGIGGDVTAGRPHQNLLISNNVIKMGTVAGAASCIFASTSGDRWVIMNNILSGSTYGVRIGVLNNVDDFAVIGNSFFDHTNGVLFSGSGTLTGLRIQNNGFVSITTAVNIGPTGGYDLISITNNTYRSVTTNFTGASATNITREEPEGSGTNTRKFWNNIQLVGGAWDTEHLMIGDASVEFHIWQDGTNLFGKKGAPTSATDGTIIF